VPIETGTFLSRHLLLANDGDAEKFSGKSSGHSDYDHHSELNPGEKGGGKRRRLNNATTQELLADWRREF